MRRNLKEQELINEMSGEIKTSFPKAKKIFISFKRMGNSKVITKIKVQVKKKIFYVEAVAYDLLDSIWEAKELLDLEFSHYGRKRVHIKM